MKLLFKQRMFSWFDSYDIYDEMGNVVYEVKGQLSWGHCLKIFAPSGQELGTVKQQVLTWLPKFEVYEGSSYMGLHQQGAFLLDAEISMISMVGRLKAASWNGIIPLPEEMEKR